MSCSGGAARRRDTLSSLRVGDQDDSDEEAPPEILLRKETFEVGLMEPYEILLHRKKEQRARREQLLLERQDSGLVAAAAEVAAVRPTRP